MAFCVQSFRVKYINLLYQIICPADDLWFSALPAARCYHNVCTVNMTRWLQHFQCLENFKMCFFSFLPAVTNDCKAITVGLKISDEYKDKRNHNSEQIGKETTGTKKEAIYIYIL